MLIKKNNNVDLHMEYEQLYNWLESRRREKYDIIDNPSRLKHKDESKILSPGVCNKVTNQSAINFEEPNTKAVYPDSEIPYSQGVVWE